MNLVTNMTLKFLFFNCNKKNSLKSSLQWGLINHIIPIIKVQSNSKQHQHTAMSHSAQFKVCNKSASFPNPCVSCVKTLVSTCEGTFWARELGSENSNISGWALGLAYFNLRLHALWLIGNPNIIDKPIMLLIVK